MHWNVIRHAGMLCVSFDVYNHLGFDMKLYRGICKSDDEKNNGKVLSKGSVKAVAALADGHIKADGTFVAGPCISNTARAHQIESGLYGAAGISTSRDERVAIKFATSNYTESGYVYVIDASRLAAEDVSSLEFPDPVEPAEQEVTLILHDAEYLPSCVIIEKYEVNCEGLRYQ